MLHIVLVRAVLVEIPFNCDTWREMHCFFVHRFYTQMHLW